MQISQKNTNIRDSSTNLFLRNLRIFKKHLLWRTLANDCFYKFGQYYGGWNLSVWFVKLKSWSLLDYKNNTTSVFQTKSSHAIVTFNNRFQFTCIIKIKTMWHQYFHTKKVFFCPFVTWKTAVTMIQKLYYRSLNLSLK